MRARVQQARTLSGQSVTLMGVIGLHIAIIAALIAIKVVPPIMNKETAPFEMVDVPREVIPPPPPPDIPVKPPTQLIAVTSIVPPDIADWEDAPTAETAPPQATDSDFAPPDAGSGEGPVISSPPSRKFTDLTYRAVMSPNVFYPPTSVSLQEQGTAIVRVCVDGAGRLDGVPTIQATSGFKRLDQAAVKWTREALRFTAATEDGVGVRSCKGFKVVFNLN